MMYTIMNYYKFWGLGLEKKKPPCILSFTIPYYQDIILLGIIFIMPKLSPNQKNIRCVHQHCVVTRKITPMTL
jgi:hypothetical protein